MHFYLVLSLHLFDAVENAKTAVISNKKVHLKAREDTCKAIFANYHYYWVTDALLGALSYQEWYW